MGLLFYTSKYNRGINYLKEFETLEDALKFVDNGSFSEDCWYGYYEKWDINKFQLKKVFTGRFPDISNPFVKLEMVECINGKYYFPVH